MSPPTASLNLSGQSPLRVYLPGKGEVALTQTDYLATGGAANALNNHADEAWQSLGPLGGSPPTSGTCTVAQSSWPND